MPQGGDPTAPRAAATAYQCAVKQGLVWVKLQPAPTDGSGAGCHRRRGASCRAWRGFCGSLRRWLCLGPLVGTGIACR